MMGRRREFGSVRCNQKPIRPLSQYRSRYLISLCRRCISNAPGARAAAETDRCGPENNAAPDGAAAGRDGPGGDSGNGGGVTVSREEPVTQPGAH